MSTTGGTEGAPKRRRPGKKATQPQQPKNPPDPPDTQDDDDIEIGKLREALAAARQSNDHLTAQLTDVSGRLDKATATINDQQGQIGRLTEVAAQLQQVTGERDQLKGQLDDVQGNLAETVASAVQDRVGSLTSAQDSQIQDLTRSRDQLQARVTELENALGAGDAPSMPTADFAGHFVQVLSGLSTQQEGAAAPWAAAVTGISVSAKGLLRPGTDGGVDIVTPDAGAVVADQLSTVNFELKLLPRLGTQPADGGGGSPTPGSA